MSNVAPSDAGEAGLGLASDFLAGKADDLIKGSGVIKGAHGTPIGQAVSGMQSAYHLGSAVYDGVTGDRDGAVAHGAQALYNAAAVVPGFNAVTEHADSALSFIGSGARVGAEMLGYDDVSAEIPTGLDDVAASSAVGLTNLLFGADEDAGTGTREGEISAGMGTMNAMLSVAGGPVGMANAYLHGQIMGDAISGVTSKGDKTSGAEPGLVAQTGASLHDYIFGGE